MNHLISSQSLAAAALALGALTAASSAHARSDVYFSIGVQVPGVYVQTVPVHVQPRTYYAPAPNYYRRHDDGRRSQWQSRGPYGDRDRDGIVNIYDQGGHRSQWRQARLYGPYGDLDRDGIINKHDRQPNNPYRR